MMVDVTPELRRRIKVAAAERDQTVRDYVVEILERAVPREQRPPSQERPRGRLVTAEMVERFRQIQAEQGQPFADDSTELLRELRAERDAQLEQAVRGGG